MLPITTTVSPLEIAQLEAMLEESRAQQKSILLARQYFNGEQTVYLNARALEFLGIHDNNTFKLNICRTIVTALSAELNLLGFDTDEPAGADGVKPLAAWAGGLFKKNKLDSLQDTIHEGALSDSESFIIVEWEPREGYARFIHNPRFIDPDVGGDGMGVFMVYENDDVNQRPTAAVKQWIETKYIGRRVDSVLRRTVYYPDRIERWIYQQGSWKPYLEEGLAWPIPWLDGGGAPIGIPVFHFYNKGSRPEHWDGIPMQDATNKTLVDALAAGDLTAFQSFFGFGFYPTIDGKEPSSDGSNVFRMGPAQFNGTMKPASEAALQVISGADISPFYEALKTLVLFTAQITETPASRFVVTAQIAAEDTLKEQDQGLKKKAADRRGLFSDPWVAAVSMARKLTNLNAPGILLSEEPAFSTIWEHTETLETLAKKRESLSIPLEQIWREAGYSEAVIEGMKNSSEYKVQFERALWEGYNAASLSGIPLEIYLRRAGLPEDEILKLKAGIRDNENIPPVDL